MKKSLEKLFLIYFLENIKSLGFKNICVNIRTEKSQKLTAVYNKRFNVSVAASHTK